MGLGRRLGGAKVSMRSVSLRVLVVVPLTSTRVTLNDMRCILMDERLVAGPRVLR